MIIVALYIPSDTNNKEALEEIEESVTKLQTTQPDSFSIITEVFNQACI